MFYDLLKMSITCAIFIIETKSMHGVCFGVEMSALWWKGISNGYDNAFCKV